MASLRYSIRVNGIEKIAITKLDVLDEFDEIRVCTGYKVNGRTMGNFPTDVQTLESVEPQYRVFKGWRTRTSDFRSYAKLPAPARKYVDAIGSMLETRIWMVSVGARRDQTLIVK